MYFLALTQPHVLLALLLVLLLALALALACYYIMIEKTAWRQQCVLSGTDTITSE